MSGSGGYISREAALKECDWYANEFIECEYAIMPLKGALEILPAADVRPVVLCRDCRHRDPEDHKCDCGQFERTGCPFPVDDDYFCAYGERANDA